jgi:glycosyltransferase involved in cell wall biosynthesis
MLSTKTTAISKTEHEQVIHWPFIQKKLITIPLGIEAPYFLPKDDARKALFALAGQTDHGQQLIFSIGELTTNKGYSYAFDALKQYTQNYTYLIAGTGELEHRFKEVVSSHPELKSRVHLLGYVSQAAQYMKGANVLLLPSIKEGIPYVLLEAAFAGIPVISTNVGGITEIVNPATAANLILPHNSEVLLNALNEQRFAYCSQQKLEDMVTSTLEHYL